MNSEVFSLGVLLVVLMELLLTSWSDAAPLAAASRALRAAAAPQQLHIRFNPDSADVDDLVHPVENVRRRRKRHADTEALNLEESELSRGGEKTVRRRRRRSAGTVTLDEVESEEVARALRGEARGRRARRSTVMLALTMSLKTCQLRPCNVEYEEGNKKIRFRIADM